MFKKIIKALSQSKEKQFYRAIIRNDCQLAEALLLEDANAPEKERYNLANRAQHPDLTQNFSPLTLVINGFLKDHWEGCYYRHRIKISGEDRLKMIFILIKYGADVNALSMTVDRLVETPLSFVVSLRHIFLKRIEAKNADDNQINRPKTDFSGPLAKVEYDWHKHDFLENDRTRPYYQAVQSFMQQTATCLLEAGANPLLHALDYSFARDVYLRVDNRRKYFPEPRNRHAPNALQYSLAYDEFALTALLLRYALTNETFNLSDFEKHKKFPQVLEFLKNTPRVSHEEEEKEMLMLFETRREKKCTKRTSLGPHNRPSRRRE